LALTMTVPVVVDAQQPREGHNDRVITPHDWWRLGAFAAGTALALPFDRRLANQFERPSWHRNGLVVHGAEGVRALGDRGVLLLSTTIGCRANCVRCRPAYFAA